MQENVLHAVEHRAPSPADFKFPSCDSRADVRKGRDASSAKSGEAVLFDLNGLSEKDLQKLSLSWVNPHQLLLEAGNLTKSFTVP